MIISVMAGGLMTQKSLKISISLVLALGILLIASSLTGTGMWLFFMIPVLAYVTLFFIQTSECESCGKPIGFDPDKKQSFLLAFSFPSLTCRHCGHKH